LNAAGLWLQAEAIDPRVVQANFGRIHRQRASCLHLQNGGRQNGGPKRGARQEQSHPDWTSAFSRKMRWEFEVGASFVMAGARPWRAVSNV